MKNNNNQEYWEDSVRFSCAITALLLGSIGKDAFLPCKFLFGGIFVLLSAAFAYMPWKLEARLKQQNQPSEHTQKRLQELRWEKWLITGFTLLLWLFFILRLF